MECSNFRLSPAAAGRVAHLGLVGPPKDRFRPETLLEVEPQGARERIPHRLDTQGRVPHSWIGGLRREQVRSERPVHRGGEPEVLPGERHVLLVM